MADSATNILINAFLWISEEGGGVLEELLESCPELEFDQPTSAARFGDDELSGGLPVVLWCRTVGYFF